MIRRLFERLTRWWCARYITKRPVRRITRDGTAGAELYLERYYFAGKEPAYPEAYDKPVTLRWTWLPTIYVHRFVRSDFGRDLHNHPFPGKSLILAGGYSEERRFPWGKMDIGWWPNFYPDSGEKGTGFWVGRRDFKPLMFNDIEPETFHRVDLLGSDAWTLFWIGEKVASWGFWDRWSGRFTNWKEYIAKRREEL